MTVPPVASPSEPKDPRTLIPWIPARPRLRKSSGKSFPLFYRTGFVFIQSLLSTLACVNAMSESQLHILTPDLV
jgi:hypothetical protein